MGKEVLLAMGAGWGPSGGECWITKFYLCIFWYTFFITFFLNRLRIAIFLGFFLQNFQKLFYFVLGDNDGGCLGDNYCPPECTCTGKFHVQ